MKQRTNRNKKCQNSELTYKNYTKFKWSKYINQKVEIGSIKKYDPTICCVHKNHFKYNDIGRLEKRDGQRYII